MNKIDYNKYEDHIDKKIVGRVLRWRNFFFQNVFCDTVVILNFKLKSCLAIITFLKKIYKEDECLV